jgi:hypothetical protein
MTLTLTTIPMIRRRTNDMSDMRASQLSFLQRYDVTGGPDPEVGAIERVMLLPADEFETNCNRIREFIATMNRPLSPTALSNFREVWELMRYYDQHSPRRSLLSPNGRVLTTWHGEEYKDHSMVDRSLIVKVANLDQLEKISRKINNPHRYPSVSGPVRFLSSLDWQHLFGDAWYYERDDQVCRLHSSDFVERGDIFMTYEILIIAPKVQR